jgi:HicB family
MRMDITPYVDNLRRDLVTAADAGGAEVKDAAERLAMALGPSARLALMEVLSDAAAEITAELPSGAVDVRLNGRDLDFVVTFDQAPPAPPLPPAPPTPPRPEEIDDDGNLARITLRIPDSVKTRAEEYAAAQGQSLNTWLVNLVRSATSGQVINLDVDLSSIPLLGEHFGRRPGNRRMSGWI